MLPNDLKRIAWHWSFRSILTSVCLVTYFLIVLKWMNEWIALNLTCHYICLMVSRCGQNHAVTWASCFPAVQNIERFHLKNKCNLVKVLVKSFALTQQNIWMTSSCMCFTLALGGIHEPNQWWPSKKTNDISTKYLVGSRRRKLFSFTPTRKGLIRIESYVKLWSITNNLCKWRV